MMVMLLGAIEAPHEASSQLERASEVTWKWSVVSFPLVFRASLADPVRLSLSSTGRDAIPHSAHGLGARVVRGTGCHSGESHLDSLDFSLLT